jgi:ADP-ribosylglycohydrolase
MNLQNRVLGCLGGLALGDSLGGPTEFLTPAQIQKEYGWVDGFVLSPSWHPHHGLQPGQITDDTGQVLAIAHALQPDGLTTAEQVARSLLEWDDQGGERLSAIVGPSTRQALEKLRGGESPRQTGREGTTNGAAYRGVIPGLVNFYRPERILDQVVEVCLPTHGTRTAISGAAAVAYAIAQALTEAPSLEALLDSAKYGARVGLDQGAWVWATPLEKRIELAVRLVEENLSDQSALTALHDFVGVDMLVAESVATAFGLVALAKGDPMKAVVFSANIGGDTDTIGAIAGAICGAWRGAGTLDKDMLNRVEEINHLDLASEASRLVSIIENR